MSPVICMAVLTPTNAVNAVVWRCDGEVWPGSWPRARDVLRRLPTNAPLLCPPACIPHSTPPPSFFALCLPAIRVGGSRSMLYLSILSPLLRFSCAIFRPEAPSLHTAGGRCLHCT